MTTNPIQGPNCQSFVHLYCTNKHNKCSEAISKYQNSRKLNYLS